MEKKEKMTKHCEHCGAEFKTHMSRARYCKASHRIYAFNKRRIERLRELEARE